jgi:hypothetical protein
MHDDHVGIESIKAKGMGTTKGSRRIFLRFSPALIQFRLL